MKVYDQSFNQNEWFVLILLTAIYLTIYFMPKRFSTAVTLTLVVLGIYIGMLSDHTVSIPPFDFYDVNNNSSYEIFDFLTYVMYGPFGYIFLYLYDCFKIKGYKTILYIILWTVIAIVLEYVAVRFAVFHYKQGYRMIFSIPIYLGFQSLTILYYHLLKSKTNPYATSENT